MAQGPGRAHRTGLSLIELFELFPDNQAAEQWWIEQRWPDGVVCPFCGSDNVQHRSTGKPQPYRCRDCRRDFSAKTGTLMQGSPLSFRIWVIAIYILTTGIKGTSSMELHRALKVNQRTAWYLAHRIRETWADNAAPFTGDEVEADETWIGGKDKNRHKRKRSGRQGKHSMIAVAGVKDRKTKKVRAVVVDHVDSKTLVPFVRETAPGATVYTDESNVYLSLPNHKAVNHGIGKYVDGQAHTNGMESFWSLMKRGYHGTYHRMSPKHLHRYVAEFSGRFNDRPLDTIEQMRRIAKAMEGKRLKYSTLIRETGRHRRAV